MAIEKRHWWSKISLVLVCIFGLFGQGKAQQKRFFQSIELSLNGYVGDGFTTNKNQWPSLFKHQPTYRLDTFPQREIFVRNGMATIFPNPVSLGIATTKALNIPSKRLQFSWQLGVQFQPYINNELEYYTTDTSTRFVASNYTDVALEHRSQWMNIDNQFQCSFKSFLLPKQITYTVGLGLGLMWYTKSDIEETVTRYRRIPSGNGFLIQQDSKTLQVVSAKKPLMVNYSLGASMAFQAFKHTSVTLGMQYQNFRKPFGWNNRWFADDGFLSMGLRHNF